MPTNLPPDYFGAEKRYRAAESTAEKIACLEEMMSTIPKHKGTDHLRADLRRQLSKLKAEKKSSKRPSKHQSAFRVVKEGAGQVAVIGPANVGKSALVATLTNASPEVSEAPFTTWSPTPGMMLVGNVQVQLVDTPPLDRDYVESELFDLIRRADLILLVVDLLTYPVEQLKDTLAILEEHNIAPLHLKQRYTDERYMSFIPLLVIANKCDDKSCDGVFDIFGELLEEEWPLLPVSVTNERNLDDMKQAVFDELEIIRVYSKIPGKEPDLGEPFALKKGNTVADMAAKVHLDFYENLKSARVWGSSAFDGQMVQKDYVLQDGDVVELRI